jgi:proline-specific peptidase
MNRISYVLILFWAYSLPANADNIQPGQGFIEVPGGPVWYRVTGEGDGIPLLTLHGGPGGTSCGFSLLEVLGSERPVVRYDQLGTGRSGRPDDLSLWTVERFVEELHVLRQELGFEQLHLLGKDAALAKDNTTRAEVYAKFLTACGSCHAVARKPK